MSQVWKLERSFAVVSAQLSDSRLRRALASASDK
jgi:hypothetical protein